jgi:hypothetical protein
MNKKTLEVEIGADLRPFLSQQAQKEAKTMNEVVDEIVREYLTKIRLITDETVYPITKETIIIRDEVTNE